MKKFLVLSLVIVSMLLFASAAYANTTSGYADWSTAAPNDTVPTPHKGYELTTNKCAVCHAVHKGDDGGEVLLRSTVADACTYCHIDANLGLDRIYNGDAAAYTADFTVAQSFDGGFAHNPNGAACTRCHSVHGADTIDGYAIEKILKDWPTDGTAHAYSTYALDEWADPSTVAVQDEQITAWCTGCHKYYTPYYADGSATGYVDVTRYSSGSYIFETKQSHVMTAATASYGNSQATITDQVAWAGSQACRDCHDAGTTGEYDDAHTDPATVIRNSFPHYTPDYYRFMTIGDELGDSQMNTTGTVDGLCLKCHVNTGGAEGVGVGF